MNKKIKNIFKSSLMGLTLLLCSCHINVLDHNNNIVLKKVRAEDDNTNLILYNSVISTSNIRLNFKERDGSSYTASQQDEIRQNCVLNYSNNILTLTYDSRNNLNANTYLRSFGISVESFSIDLGSFDSAGTGGQKFSYRVITDPSTMIRRIFYSDYIYSINNLDVGGGSTIMQDSPAWNYTYTDNVFIEDDNEDNVGKYLLFEYSNAIAISNTSYKLNLAYICFLDYSQEQYFGTYSNDTDINDMYEQGVQNGILQGKVEGKEETINDLYQGKTYQQIFTEGVLQGERNTQSFGSLLPTLFGSLVNIPISVLNGLAPLTFFDLSIIKVVITLLMLNVILWIIRKVLI